MWSDIDLKFIVDLVKQKGTRRIYITGHMKVGKSTFCKKFREQVSTYKYIEYDKEVEKPLYQKMTSRSDRLSRVINEYKDDYYILDYYRLLDENDGQKILKTWKGEADILILLNPNPNLIPNFLDEFNKLGGEIIYQNTDTGTYVKLMGKNDQPDK